METGIDYDKLPDLWSIWILPYDPFGMDYMMYSVKNIVEENPEIDYNDGVRKLFLYTGGKNGGTDALKDLLIYIQNSIEENAVDEDLKILHSNVERLKENRKIGVKYMQMQERMKYEIEAAVEAAVEGTEQRINKLYQILLKEKKYEDLEKASEDTDYRKMLMEKYNIQ